MNKSIVGGVTMAALVMAARWLSGCRRVSAAIIASAVLALCSPGAMAATNACRGAGGTSAVTGTAVLLYLQCYQAIPISGNPLQTFGGSTFVRKSSTTASYYLADRSNLGIDVIDGQALKFSRLLKPSAADPVGGFIGQLIWTVGPATTGTTRIGTPDESHSGPNGITIYTDPSGANWLFVADGGCNILIKHASPATPSSAGTEGACGTPADPSTLPNANYGTANCNNGTSTKGCYPTQHQPNIKLFNLTTNAFVKSYPTGGGPSGPNTPCAGCYPLGDYAPTSLTLKGHFGASRADAIAIGTAGGTTFMLVSTPGEPFIPVAAQSTSTKFGACDAAALSVPPETPPPPFTSQATESFPYLTLFKISAGNPPTATYLATINVDDTSTGSLVGNGPFGCDFNGKRPPNPIGGVHWDPRIDRFIVALPNVLNNIPVNQKIPFTTSITTSAATASGSNVLHFASVPSTILIGQPVVDVTTPGAIPPGTTVIGTTSTTVTMSANATGGGVLSGDQIAFNILPASAPTPPGSNVLHFVSVPSTILIGQPVVDVTTPGAIPPGTTVIGTTLTTVTMSANATGGGVLSGDQIAFQNIFTTSAPTASGSNVLTFTSVPSTIALGQLVVDVTTPGAIPPGTTVVGTTLTQVMMSANATGGGILSGDQIAFAVGDGSGPGQNFVPDGPTGGPQTTPVAQGCFYPQGTPAGANSVGTFFWSCDGGLLVVDPTAVANNALNTVGYTPSAAGVVLKLGYCSPGSIAAGPDLDLANTVPGAPPYKGDFANVFLGCSPKFNGNTAGTGSAVNIAENYSVALDVKSSPFGLPGPFPAVDPVSPFNQTVAGMNPSNSPPATPPTPGCSVQKPDCPTMGQLNGGAIYGYPAFGTLFLNGVTAAHLNVGKFARDPHWYVAVGGSGFSSANIANLATRTPVIGYVDALSNEVIEFTPTSSGSNTIALDEQNYLAYVPVNGVAGPQVPAGDFTGNGVKLCGNAIINGGGTVTSRGCVIVFRQQYLGPGPRPQ